MALKDNLISYWKFDETSGTSASDSVASNTLTLGAGDTFNSVGKINFGLRNNLGSATDGAGFNFLLADNFSISFWEKISSLSGANQMFISKGVNQWNVYIGASTHKLQAAIPGIANILTGSALSADSTYHHIVLTVAGGSTTSTWTMYLDNNQDSTNTDTNAMTTNAFNLAVGGEAGGSVTSQFDGFIDELGIWSRTLSSADVSQLYNSGAGNQYPFSGGSSNFLDLLGVGS